MEKIEISSKDYQCNGLGYNNYNFCQNVALKISKWLFIEHKDVLYKSFEEQENLAKKLKKIIDIINEEEELDE